MKYFSLFIFSIIFANSFVGQQKSKNNVKFLLGLDANRSFVLNKKSKFWGVRIGAEVEKKYRLGLAIHAMQKPLIFERSINADKYPNASKFIKLNFSYYTIL